MGNNSVGWRETSDWYNKMRSLGAIFDIAARGAHSPKPASREYWRFLMADSLKWFSFVAAHHRVLQEEFVRKQQEQEVHAFDHLARLQEYLVGLGYSFQFSNDPDVAVEIRGRPSHQKQSVILFSPRLAEQMDWPFIAADILYDLELNLLAEEHTSGLDTWAQFQFFVQDEPFAGIDHANDAKALIDALIKNTKLRRLARLYKSFGSDSMREHNILLRALSTPEAIAAYVSRLYEIPPEVIDFSQPKMELPAVIQNSLTASSPRRE